MLRYRRNSIIWSSVCRGYIINVSPKMLFELLYSAADVLHFACAAEYKINNMASITIHVSIDVKDFMIG